MSQPIVSAVKNKIYGHGRGWCFTPKHFLDLGSDTGVRTALFRLQREKIIRRVAQGIYEYPRKHKVLGTLPPQVDGIAKALAEKENALMQPTGAYAANLIGLSEQVPAKVIFLTDGPSRKIKLGKNREIIFKKTTVKNMFAAGSQEALAIQAFKFIQQKHIDETMLQTTKRFLKGTIRSEFEKNIKYAPKWIRDLLLNLMKKAP